MFLIIIIITKLLLLFLTTTTTAIIVLTYQSTGCVELGAECAVGGGSNSNFLPYISFLLPSSLFYGRITGVM